MPHLTIALASPRVATTLDDGLAKVARLVGEASARGASIVCLPFPESATAVIGPQGVCEASLPYGEEGVLLHTIDLDAATGLLARRFAPERY